MSIDRVTSKYVVIAISGLVLSACSRSGATAIPPASATAPVAATATAVGPATGTVVTGLPDFTALVEHYGPAVVNVQVTEGRPQTQVRGPQGADPSDPFNEFFRRFGIPNPNGRAVDSAAIRRPRRAWARDSSSARMATS